MLGNGHDESGKYGIVYGRGLQTDQPKLGVICLDQNQRRKFPPLQKTRFTYL